MLAIGRCLCDKDRRGFFLGLSPWRYHLYSIHIQYVQHQWHLWDPGGMALAWSAGARCSPIIPPGLGGMFMILNASMYGMSMGMDK